MHVLWKLVEDTTFNPINFQSADLCSHKHMDTGCVCKQDGGLKKVTEKETDEGQWDVSSRDQNKHWFYQ